MCTDYLSACDRAMARSAIRLVDRQLAAAPLSSQEGKDYLAAMAAAANYAFANRWASASPGGYSQAITSANLICAQISILEPISPI